MVPEAEEPVLQLLAVVVEGTGHEHAWTQVHHIGVELVDEEVEMVEQVRDPVHQTLSHWFQGPGSVGRQSKTEPC